MEKSYTSHKFIVPISENCTLNEKEQKFIFANGKIHIFKMKLEKI